MIEIPLTKEAERYGRDLRRHYDSTQIRDDFRPPGADRRWVGYAVEHSIAHWLREQGYDFQWNGGMDDLPDYVFGDEQGLDVALKSNSGDGPRDDFEFIVNEPHVNRLGDGVIFSIVNVRDRKIWLAGYIAASDFRRQARRRRRGDPGFVPGKRLQYACRTIKAHDLQPAETFFALMRRAA